MSQTIHYFGRLKRNDLLPELQEEFAEFALVSGWNHEIVDHVFPREDGQDGPRQTLKGIRIHVSPADGPVQFTFDQEGFLSHLYYESEAPSWPVGVKSSPARSVLRSAPGRNRILHHVHTHTTLRSSEPYPHVTVVNLLDYLGKKYVPNLEVIDNTGYWSSRDEKALGFRPLAPTAI
jgi:hypothetical protein